MSAVSTLRNCVSQPVVGLFNSPRAGSSSRSETGKSAARKQTHRAGESGPGSKSLLVRQRGAREGRAKNERRRTSICNCLQPWTASVALSSSDIHTSTAIGSTGLFFSLLRVSENVIDRLGLAHRLRERCAYEYGHDSHQSVPSSGASGGFSTPAERRQQAQGQGCAPFRRADPAGVRLGIAFPRL